MRREERGDIKRDVTVCDLRKCVSINGSMKLYIVTSIMFGFLLA